MKALRHLKADPSRYALVMTIESGVLIKDDVGSGAVIDWNRAMRMRSLLNPEASQIAVTALVSVCKNVG